MREAEPRAISFVSHCETGTQPGGKKTCVSSRHHSLSRSRILEPCKFWKIGGWIRSLGQLEKTPQTMWLSQHKFLYF